MRRVPDQCLLLPPTDESKAVRLTLAAQRHSGLLLLLLWLRLRLLLRVRVLLGYELLRPLLDRLETICHLLELALEILLFLCEFEDGGGSLGQGLSLLSPAGTVRASIWRHTTSSNAACKRFSSEV